MLSEPSPRFVMPAFSWRSALLLLLLLLPISLLAQPALEQAPGQAAVASAHYLATDAGHEIMAAGGNAFDAAVAVSAALAVVEPASSGVGGGGFWLLHRASDDMRVFVDGREIAPAAATADMYLDAQGEVNRDLAVNGPLAAGIPGHIAGIAHIAEKYGKLPLARSLQPAIRLATQGFPVDEKYHTMMRYRADVIRRWPAATEALLVDGDVPEIGTRIKLPDLASTLQMVAEKGPQAFYTGAFANNLVRGVREAGGIWTVDDLAAYKIKEREPVSLDYQGYRIVTAPPPSSGGVALAEILNIIEPYNIAGMERAQQVHLLVEAMRRAYRDRGIYLGDPDFVDMPIRQLTSRDYAAGLRASIRLDRATDSESLAGFADSPKGMDTTHFSVLDAAGNMVAATLTVNLPYGAAFMAPGTGFLLNNEMDDFSAKPGAPNAFGLLGYTANAIEPGKRMLSSMTPSFVFGADRQAALGTPGGSRIITMVLLGILDMIAGNEPASWVSLPRFHHQYQPDVISIEPDAFSPELIEQLQAMGHRVEARDSTWGNMHGVLWKHDDNAVSAGSDPRWPSGRAEVR
jgi:gamma-glutamyltranspeptidase/glutathione hydrolase